MPMSKERREALTKQYNELAEELSIFYNALIREHFDGEAAIELIKAIISQPTKLQAHKEYMDKNEAIRKLREINEERKRKIENSHKKDEADESDQT